MKSEAIIQLQRILGEEAEVEAFERVAKLLEKNDFENSILRLLERLEDALKQMKVLSGKQRFSYSSEDVSWEKFLSLTRDLLMTKIITPWEFQVALKNPERSGLPRLLRSLKKEARDLFSLLVIGYPEEVKKPVKQRDVEELLAAARKSVA